MMVDLPNHLNSLKCTRSKGTPIKTTSAKLNIVDCIRSKKTTINSPVNSNTQNCTRSKETPIETVSAKLNIADCTRSKKTTINLPVDSNTSKCTRSKRPLIVMTGDEPHNLNPAKRIRSGRMLKTTKRKKKIGLGENAWLSLLARSN